MKGLPSFVLEKIEFVGAKSPKINHRKYCSKERRDAPPERCRQSKKYRYPARKEIVRIKNTQCFDHVKTNYKDLRYLFLRI